MSSSQRETPNSEIIHLVGRSFESSPTTAFDKGRKSSSFKETSKVFIGGLNWTTDEQMLHSYFEQFGPVIECTIMRDPSTGKSRCFGFVTFSEPAVVDKIIRQIHILDSKQVPECLLMQNLHR
jgi:RNA-binding protein Musashi